MADNQIIAATVQVDTGQSNANVKELKKNLTDVKGTLAETGTAAKATGKDLEGAGGSFGKIREQLSAVSPAAAGAGEGVAKLNTGFKVLLANPIVALLAAIVAVLTLVYAAFKNSFEGGEKLEQVFSGIKAVGQSLLDSLDKIGSSIVKLFKFDFSGAIADMKEVGTAAANAFSAMSKLTKEAQELKREQATNDLDQAKRARDLAVLREQATDETVPIAKRKAALKELQAASIQNAKQDLDLAKRTTDNKIAQLTLEKDGEKKNFVEIQKLKAEQVQGETENSNELRRINKQLTAADKQERAERTAAAKEDAEKKKVLREQYAAAELQLRKLQQDNQLLSIKDGYEKEKKQLENKIADEKAANVKAFNDKKISKQQFNDIEAAEQVKADLQRDALTDKHNQELQKKEADFQKELNGIIQKTRLAGIVDARQLEKVQLEIGYEEKFQEASIRYKDDADKLFKIKQALDEQYKEAQDRIDAKNAKEDARKKLENELKKNGGILNDPAATFKAKQDALDADVKANQDAYDKMAITEDEYLAHKKENDNAENQLHELKKARLLLEADTVANTLDAVAEAIGKQTVVGKGISVASTTIATISSAVKAFDSFASIPVVGTALGVAAAVAALASGYSNVKKILAVQIPGQGGGGGGANLPSISMPAPIAPTQASTKLDASSISAINNPAAGGVNGFRAYVVEQDNAAAANRASRLAGASILGGG